MPDGFDLRKAAAFAKANRHSRRVRVLKWLLPVAAVVLGAGFLARSYLASPPAVELKAESTEVSKGKVVMSNPKLQGFTKDNLAYSMSAFRAIQDVRNEGLVTLEKISAKLPIDGNSVASIDAASGLFDQVKNSLTIDSAITIKTTDGMSADLKSAVVDIAAGTMTTDKPVEIAVKGGTVRSDMLTVQQNGKVLVFQNRVRVVIDPTVARDKGQQGDVNAQD